MWVIDILALRVGGEKGEEEADTVGCCSLRVEHLRFNPDPDSFEISLELGVKVLDGVAEALGPLLAKAANLGLGLVDSEMVASARRGRGRGRS